MMMICDSVLMMICDDVMPGWWNLVVLCVESEKNVSVKVGPVVSLVA